MSDKKKGLELKKHVAAIHTGNKLSLLQRKIANALLFNAYENLVIKDEHEIHVSTLCKLIGYGSNDHKTIKKSLVNLLSTVIEWNLVDGEKVDAEGIWNASSIIADASIDGPICTYSYSNKMKKLLHRPDLYGRLNMLVQAKFQSSYGLALYENCIRFQNIEQTPWFDILKFRRLMGVEEGKYKIFRDFKSRVLDKAIEEVNKFSPIYLEPRFKKQKRQVSAIQFVIKPSKNPPLLADDYTSTQLSLSDALKIKFGLSKKQIEDVVTAYDDEYIFEKMTIIETSPSYTGGKIKNLAKYLISALKDDYQPTKSSQRILQLVHEQRAEHDRLRKLQQDRLEEYRRFQNKEIINLFQQISQNKQTQILNEFEYHLGKSIYYDIFQRDGLANILIQDQLCLFVREKKSDFLNKILSYEEFLKKIK